MHDAAVESTNFTECVPATPGESCGSPVTEEGGQRANPSRCNGVHKGVGGCFGGRKPANGDSQRQSDVGPRWGMIRFNNCLR